MYALGIMLYAHAASTETALVARARVEAREALARCRLRGEHTPAHIGNPPNECADVTALLGRKIIDMSDCVKQTLHEAGNPPMFMPFRPCLSIDQLLQCTCLNELPVPGSDQLTEQKLDDLLILACATANVLTLHPREEGEGQSKYYFDFTAG